MHEDDEGEEATTPLKYSPYLPRPSAVTKSALAPSSTISQGIPRMAYLVDSASLIRNLCKFENGTDSHQPRHASTVTVVFRLDRIGRDEDDFYLPVIVVVVVVVVNLAIAR